MFGKSPGKLQRMEYRRERVGEAKKKDPEGTKFSGTGRAQI